MKSIRVLPVFHCSIFFLAFFLVSCNQNQKTWYLWTSFIESTDGRDGLHLAVSPDGMNWRMVKNDQSVFTPGKWVFRDPCIAKDGLEYKRNENNRILSLEGSHSLGGSAVHPGDGK
jgi:hypothetical protein